MTPRGKLKDIISRGLVIDIFQTEQAIALDWEIGSHAEEINKATFGDLFGSLQWILGRHAILAVSRLFELPNARYLIRSIPTAIKLLKLHADDLPIKKKPFVIGKLVQFGHRDNQLNRLSDTEITKLIVKEFSESLPSTAQASLNDLSRALNALKAARDKSIAHNEAIQVSEIPKATYAEIDRLIDYAKKFVGVVGFGYLGVHYESNNGEYVLRSNAERASMALKRLLTISGVLKDSRFE